MCMPPSTSSASRSRSSSGRAAPDFGRLAPGPRPNRTVVGDTGVPEPARSGSPRNGSATRETTQEAGLLSSSFFRSVSPRAAGRSCPRPGRRPLPPLAARLRPPRLLKLRDEFVAFAEGFHDGCESRREWDADQCPERTEERRADDDRGEGDGRMNIEGLGGDLRREEVSSRSAGRQCRR